MANGIPQVLIAPLRVALQSQGFPSEMVKDDGTINPAGLLAATFDEVEFRSALTPTVRVNTRQLLKEGRPNPFLAWARPTVVMRGAGQEAVVAPWGQHAGGSIIPLTGAALGLVGLGYLLAKL
jgi:hypothetical protein